MAKPPGRNSDGTLYAEPQDRAALTSIDHPYLKLKTSRARDLVA
jgi:hypothetical protein